MLVVKDDIFIVNLEGEPHRALADRRRKAPAARDVAGVLRSIDYSVAAAQQRALKVSADDQGKLAAALEQWRDQSIATFLSAYHETLSQARLWPETSQASERMLRFFELERTAYRIDHDLTNRPDWARIPMTAMLRLVEGECRLPKGPAIKPAVRRRSPCRRSAGCPARPALPRRASS